MSKSAQGNLDDIFKETLEEIKPFVLKLQPKEKQIIASWIRKLCSTSIKGTTERKNRNLYCQILGSMLRKEKIKEPFIKQPNHGKLPTIPAYMSKYLDDSLAIHEKTTKDNTQIPNWLEDDENFDDSIFSHSVLHDSYQKYKDVLTPRKREKFMLPGYISEESNISIIQPPQQNTSYESSTTNTFMFEMNSTLNENNRSPSPEIPKKSAREEYERRYAKKKTIDQKVEIVDNKDEDETNSFLHNSNQDLKYEVKLKKLETRFQEETFKIQQEHDHMVKKILDRKNREIEEVKEYYQKKITEVEGNLQKEKKKGECLHKENRDMKLLHSKEADQLREAIERGTAKTASEYEKLMYDKLADFEKEMFELQKTHRLNIRNILQEADEKMKQMALDHETDMEKMNSEVISLQADLKTKEVQAKKVQEQSEVLLKSKDELTCQVKELKLELNHQKEKFKSLEEEKSRVIKDHEKIIKDLRKKSDEVLKEVRKEREESVQKSTNVVTELESRINYYRQTIQDMELRHKRENLEKDTNLKQDIIELNIVNEKKIRNLESDFEKMEIEYQSKITSYEFSLREKETRISDLDSKLRKHSEESEKMIEMFRTKAEENSKTIFGELSTKLENVQSSLKGAREKIEEQKIEMKNRLIKQKEEYEHKMNSIQQTSEQEKLQLHQRYKKEKQIIVENHQKELSDIVKTKDELLHQKETNFQDKIASNEKVIFEMETQVRTLQEEVLQANSLRKEQIQEVSHLREEERRNAQKTEEALHTKYKSEIEKLRYSLQKEQSEEMSRYTVKMNTKLKAIEGQYVKKSNSDKSKISNLQTKLSEINQELLQKTEIMEQRMKELSEKNYEERVVAEEKLHSQLMKAQNDLDTQQIKYKQLEKKFKNLEIEYQEKISKALLQSEEKMKGLLPATIQKELESTIASLREQIVVLKSRADVLQEELNESKS